MPAFWPVSADVSSFVQDDLGLTPGSYDFGDDLLEIAAEFKAQTGRKNFDLAETVDSAKTYDPPDQLDGSLKLWIPDYISVTSVKTGYSTTSAGTVLTVATDYRLVREGDDSSPIVAIEFFTDPGSAPDSILITGKRGAYADIPGDLSRAVIKEAASRFMAATQGNTTGAKKMEKLGDRTIEYGQAGGSSELLHAAWLKTVARYTRFL